MRQLDPELSAEFLEGERPSRLPVTRPRVPLRRRPFPLPRLARGGGPIATFAVSVEPGSDADIAYTPVPGEEYGARWRSRRPPGLPPHARQASARDEAVPHVERLAYVEGLGDTFVRTVSHLARTESTARFGLPANVFDARPAAARGGKPLITAWGAFQFNRGAWRALPGVSPTAEPWDCTAVEEIARPIRRYAELFRAVAAAGGDPRDGARGIRLWHVTPAGFRAFLNRGRTGGFAAAWQQVPAERRRWIDARLRSAGVGGELAEEQREVANLNVFIRKNVDVDAQRALMQMARSPDAQQRQDATEILAMLDKGGLAGIYKPDQEVPARLSAAHGVGWWLLIRKGREARLLCNDSGKTLMVFRKNLTRQQLVAVMQKLAAMERDGRRVSFRCLIT
ncbi:MAG TPA: hypothetical protein VGS57_21460 [Thermoanaerobaculia bacterium]|jgi:hypothetical protein|nr:hypothetical protein [Thermoanaerobaculia bacterium]